MRAQRQGGTRSTPRPAAASGARPSSGGRAHFAPTPVSAGRFAPAPVSASKTPLSPPKTLRESRETGQGPFRPSASARKALFALDKGLNEIQLYATRVMPPDNPSDVDRSVLTGLIDVRGAAERLYESSTKALQDGWRGNKTPSTAAPSHKDPRKGMKDSLTHAKSMMVEVSRTLAAHEATLGEHVNRLRDSVGQLTELHEAWSHCVDELNSSRSLTSPRGLASPTSPPKQQTLQERLSSKKSPRAASAAARSPTALSASGGSRAGASPKVGKWTAHFDAPWSDEDRRLIALVREHGLDGAALAKGLDGTRTSGACQERWIEMLENALKLSRERMGATRKAEHAAREALGAVVATVTRERSQVQLATRRMQGLATKAAEARARGRNSENVAELRVSAAELADPESELSRLSKLLEAMGPRGLLRLLMPRDGIESVQDELCGNTPGRPRKKSYLHFEVGQLPAAPPRSPDDKVKARHVIRIRNARTSQVVLDWTEPEERSTDPSRSAEPQDKVTKMLYGGGA